MTVGSGNVYLITVDGLALTDEELTFPALELLGIVIPTMLRNFKLDEQTFSTFIYGVSTPHTLQVELDEQPFSTFEIEPYGVYTLPAPQNQIDQP